MLQNLTNLQQTSDSGYIVRTASKTSAIQTSSDLKEIKSEIHKNKYYYWYYYYSGCTLTVELRFRLLLRP